MKLKQCECSSSASNMYKGLAFEKVRLLNQYGKDIFVNKIFVQYGTSWERVSVYSALYILDTCSKNKQTKKQKTKVTDKKYGQILKRILAWRRVIFLSMM